MNRIKPVISLALISLFTIIITGCMANKDSKTNKEVIKQNSNIITQGNN